MHHNFLFDLDQTLLDFHASEYKALEIVLTANGLSFSDEIYQAFKAYNKSLWLELEKGTISRTELFTKRFEDVLRRCEGDSSMLDPLKINDDFIRTMSVNGVLMNGALEFVKKVKAGIPNARIYIASNGATVNAKGRIASTGLDRYIDGLFVSEDMGVTKPSAEFFDICLKQIGEPKETCIMIGDSLSSDMLGAKNASLSSVWFMPAGNIGEAMNTYGISYCASSFDELYGILKKWSADQDHRRSLIGQRVITYRKLTENDLETFISMRITQLREEGATEQLDLAPALLDYYHRHMSDNTFVSWLALDGDRIVGTSGMSFVEKPPYFGCPTGRIGLLSSMYTDPQYRRQGIARKLLGLVVEEARQYGCGSVQITASDMGVLLYQDYGFVKNGNFMQYRL